MLFAYRGIQIKLFEPRISLMARIGVFIRVIPRHPRLHFLFARCFGAIPRPLSKEPESPDNSPTRLNFLAVRVMENATDNESG